MKYALNFLRLPTITEPNFEPFEQYFRNYHPSDWAENGGGSFVAISDDGHRYSLNVIEHKNYGIALYYSKMESIRNSMVSYISPEEINNFIEVEDNIFMPLGSFMEPEIAGDVLEEFLTSPSTVPRKTKWIDDNKLNWPLS